MASSGQTNAVNLQAKNGDGMASGYVVAAAPRRVGRVWGDTLRDLRTDRGLVEYRGADREPWLDVDDLADANPNQPLLQTHCATRRREHAFSAGVCTDTAMADWLLGVVLPGVPDAELIWIDNEGATPPQDLAFLGYDCFVDGYGSLLWLGMFTRPEVFADAAGMVNVYGLCTTREALAAYARLYHERYEEAVLEIVEPQMVSEACIFRIYGRVGS